MKRVAILFVLVVFVPSLLLACLAVRSIRDQEYLLERQQSLLYQGIADAMVKEMQTAVVTLQESFEREVDTLVAQRDGPTVASQFDAILRRDWPYAEVGFVVSLQGDMLCPSLFADANARQFRLDNDRFLCNTEATEVFYNSSPGQQLDMVQQPMAPPHTQQGSVPPQQYNPLPSPPTQQRIVTPSPSASPAQGLTQKSVARKINPAQQWQAEPASSKLMAGTAEFQSLVANAESGTVARYLQNQLNLLFWYRLPQDPQLVFGAQINREKLLDHLQPRLSLSPDLFKEISMALLNENGQPVFLTHDQFTAEWKRPLVASELGEFLPHWELAVYLLNPAKLNQSAQTLRITLGLVITLLVLAILVGGWLVAADVRRQLQLARQKTDFVSNVSHELKTPLTSIRMFGELLAEGRVPDPDKQKRFLRIITAESERLTRLINNVLDFARMERAEKKYEPRLFDLNALVREVVDMYRPHLESNGFQVECRLPEQEVPIRADRDAIAQVLVNLISNAEKYSPERREIGVELSVADSGPARIRVLDRGTGVPENCREKIFEQFFRAHDALSGGIQGFGLGLTLARQIAQAHSGHLRCHPRVDGGTCFELDLPIETSSERNPT